MDSTPDLDWQRLDELVRRDPAARGLASYRDADGDPIPSDLATAALDLAELGARVLLVTGFYIATPDGPRAEADGPLGAVFLAGMLRACGVEVDIATDELTAPIVRAGLHAAALMEVGVIEATDEFSIDTCEAILSEGYSHLVAIERVGPNHTLDSIVVQDEAAREAGLDDEPQRAEFEQLVAEADRDTCRNMRGEDIDDQTPPLHWLFEFDFSEAEDAAAEEEEEESEESLEEEPAAEDRPSLAGSRTHKPAPVTTIGIADGGNEIGCGNILWSTLRRAVAQGPIALTACRIPADYLILSGISNWGAYGLGAAVAALCEQHDALRAWTPEHEASILRAMVEVGAVDGVSKRAEPSVDGVALDPYLDTFDEIRKLMLSTTS